MRQSLLLSLIAGGLLHSLALAQVAKSSARPTGAIDLPSKTAQLVVARGSADPFYFEAFGSGLPFARSNDPRDRLAEGSIFTVFLGEQPPLEGDAQDPLLPDQQPEMHPADPFAANPRALPATMPSVIAGRSVGLVIFIVGVVGWILLTIAFLILVGRRPKSGPE